MSQTLYRKFRPQTYADVIGQNHIKITLQNEIISEQIAHAYLFTGPRGIGKTSLARIFAKSLNCLEKKVKQAEPCNKCSSCLAITQGNSFDIIEIDAATHTQVDKVRDNIIENINFPPHGKYKIFIIDEVHMLSSAAFNALLKTLEEPPAFVVFILCTTESHKLPETIISRCQRFDFKKVSTELIAGKLKKITAEEKINIEAEVLQTIALRSGGFIRDAESLLGQVISLIGEDTKSITLDDTLAILPRSDLNSISLLSQSLINKDTKKCLEIINSLIDEGVDLERFNLDALDYFRKMILIKNGLKNLDESIFGLGEEIIAGLIEQADKISNQFLLKILAKFITAQTELKEAEIPQLPLEMLAIELCEDELSENRSPQPEINKTTSATSQERQPQPSKSKISSELNEVDNKNKEENSSDDTNINTTISLEEIKSQWSEIIKASQDLNHSLPLILKSSYPISLHQGQLEIGSEFEIHIQRLKSHQCLANAEQIFKKILNVNLRLKPINISREQAENLRQARQEEQILPAEVDAEEIAKSFGGKIIE